jgi:hypothetical protein
LRFFLCAMVEWQHPPLNLPSLECPTIGYTSDFDAQILTVAPWLKAFDHILTCDQLVEWRCVRAIKGTSVHTFPLVFAAPPEVPPASNRGARYRRLFFGHALLVVSTRQGGNRP